MDPRRSERVSEALREELEEMIGYEMADPRIEAAGVSEVLISPDSRHAHVRVVLTGEREKQEETLKALDGARNYLRGELSRRLGIFRIPELHFEAALAPELGARAGQLLKRVRKGRARQEAVANRPAGDAGDSHETPPEVSKQSENNSFE